MSEIRVIPSFRVTSLLLAALSLSIGWGIRGNFGHEFGAMLAGTLCGIAVSLFSGREDWIRRVLYFAFFGAIGWGFGGSMSYMQVVSYTESGHLPSQIYGFFGVFMLGFLWSSLGGAGTAFAAVEDRDRLTQVFKPLCWIFVLWGVYYFLEAPLDEWYAHAVYGAPPADSAAAGVPHVDQRWFRQKSPFYWLDTDWVQALLALIALCAYDLWERRFRRLPLLGVMAAAGAFLGWAIQYLLRELDLLNGFVAFVVQPQGDITAPIRDASGKLLALKPEDFVTNWPQFFFDFSQHLGWGLGLVAGIALYFIVFGKWRAGASLPLHMAVGWYVGFLAMPVFLSLFFGEVGGFRMTPPRGDNWAGMVGMFVAVLVYMYRNNLVAVNLAAVVTGLIGGFGLMFTQYLKMMARSLGNPALVQDPGTLEFWRHWQSANWHSIVIEQGVGLFYGLGLAVAMGLLATRAPRVSDEPRVRPWTESFCVFFLLNVLLYVNLVKIVNDFIATGGRGVIDLGNGASRPFSSVPEYMKMPLIQSVELHAWTWFSVVFLALAICTVLLLIVHRRHPIAVVPQTWLGKGQLVYLVFLWAIVIGNFMKAVVSFHEQRLATEGVIFLNAVVATFLILAFGRGSQPVPNRETREYGGLLTEILAGGAAAVVACVALLTVGTRAVYHDTPVTGNIQSSNMRLGDHADWYIKPVLKTKEHR